MAIPLRPDPAHQGADEPWFPTSDEPDAIELGDPDVIPYQPAPGPALAESLVFQTRPAG